jgi:hypothetical protein
MAMNQYINPALLAQVQERSNPLLNVPDDAKMARGGARRWAELVSITAVASSEVDKGRTEYLVNYRVSLASPNPANRGKGTRSRFLTNTAAPEGTGDFTMTMISLSNVMGLIRACVGEIDTTNGLDLGIFFDSQQSPLLGKEIIVTVTDKPDRDDPEIRRQELGSFKASN